MTKRTDMVASEIANAVQEVLARGLQDPRVSGMVTVTGVRVTPDLASAFISVSIFPPEKQQITLHGLQSAAAFVRRKAGERVEMRKLPAFVFRLDESLKRQAEVFESLARVREERAERGLPDTPDSAERPSP